MPLNTEPVEQREDFPAADSPYWDDAEVFPWDCDLQTEWTGGNE